MDNATRRAAAKAADKLLTAAGYDTRGKNLRKAMKKRRKAAHELRLEKKTGRKVKATVEIDKELIAGVKVVLGDKVIDGSARAQLGALENALKA